MGYPEIIGCEALGARQAAQKGRRAIVERVVEAMIFEDDDIDVVKRLRAAVLGASRNDPKRRHENQGRDADEDVLEDAPVHRRRAPGPRPGDVSRHPPG
jgi:hypothetical protein